MDTRYGIISNTAESSTNLLKLLTIGDGLPNPTVNFTKRYTSYSNVAAYQADRSYLDDLIEVGNFSENEQWGVVSYVQRMRSVLLYGLFVSISAAGDIVKALPPEGKGHPIIIFDQISALAVKITAGAYMRGITSVKIHFECIGVEVVMIDLTASQVASLMKFVYQYGIMALLGNLDNHKLEEESNND